MSRIKLTAPVLTSRAQAEAMAREIVELQIQQRTATNELDAGITSLKQNFEGRLSAINKTLGEKSSVLQAWAEANPSEFQGRKSLDMTHAVVGWRTGQPQAKTLAGWTWDRVLEKILTLGWEPYVRRKEEVNKQQLVADRELLKPEELRSIGVRVIQDESFFIEPKLTDQTPTIQAAA
jgi:phage host-nuclease inhibitor protein Gam